MNRAVVTYIAIVALCIGVSYLLISSFNFYDVMWWIEWCKVSTSRGIFYVYSYVNKNAYPPIPSIIISSICSSTGSELFTPTTRIVLKLCLVTAPLIALGLVLYILFRLPLRYVFIALIGIPMIIPALGPQFDILLSLIIVLNIYFTLKNRPFIAGLTLGLATLIKTFPIILAPLQVLSLGSKQRRALLHYFLGLVISLSTALPFILFNGMDIFLKKVILYHGARYPQELSLWSIPVFLFNEKVCYIPILRYVWLPFFAAVYVAILIVYYVLLHRSRLNGIELIKMSTLTLLAFIVFNKIGGPNYLAIAYPLLVLLSYRLKNRYILVLPNIASGIVFFPYGFFYRLLPMVQGKLMFIVEDFLYWSPYIIMLFSSIPCIHIPSLLWSLRAAAMVLSTLIYNLLLILLMVMILRVTDDNRLH